MFTTAIIAFREFFEAFLIVGVFLGVSRTMQLKKELEIGLAAGIGMALSIVLSVGTYLFGDKARSVLTERNADMLESYLLIFSGIFIAYVVFSLHKTMNKHRHEYLNHAKEKMQINTFDLSLFLTIVFLVLREGFEVALFSASTSLFAVFMQNVIGLLFGFIAATIVGITTFFAYIKLPISKVFLATEYMIVILGAALVQHGATILLNTHFHINLSNIFSFHLQFLPNEDTAIGHVLQGFFGIDQGFSGARLAIMGMYIGIMYVIFLKQKMIKTAKT